MFFVLFYYFILASVRIFAVAISSASFCRRRILPWLFYRVARLANSDMYAVRTFRSDLFPPDTYNLRERVI